MIFKEGERTMAHIQTQTEWEEEMAGKIVSYVRDEVYMDLRFLGPALSAFGLKMDRVLNTFATDGAYLYVPAEWLIAVFKKNAAYLDRVYLHTVLHCIYSHLWVIPETVGEEGRKQWNLACDIAVEYTIDRMDKPCTRRILGWVRQNIYKRLEVQKGGISAAVIYRFLDGIEEEERITLEREFYTDDHCYWPKREDSEAKQQIASQQKKRWQKIARESQMLSQRRGDENDEGAETFEAQVEAAKSRRSYRDFLQKFTVLKEEMRVDQDEFDLGYYVYGLSVYRDMPLIEPLESKESKKIQELVIAIDTSYSTSGELVEHFLRETYTILAEQNSFFQRFCIRVIQCDNQVRRDMLLKGTDDLERILKDFSIEGGGTTDFRPVFSYVDELISQGEIKKLGGLLYFTDGKGTYPKKRPDYPTAFLFLGDYEKEMVPPWAMRMRLE